MNSDSFELRKVVAVSPDDGKPVSDNCYIDLATVVVDDDGVGWAWLIEEGTGRRAGVVSVSLNEMGVTRDRLDGQPAIRIRETPEVSYYGDGEPSDDAPDLRMGGE